MELQITRQHWNKKAYRSIAEVWESGLWTFACTVGSLTSYLVEKQRQRQKREKLKQKTIRRVATVMVKVCLCDENA
jgi:hypothetical protein